MKKFTSALVLATFVTLATFAPVAEAAAIGNSQVITSVAKVNTTPSKEVTPLKVTSPNITDIISDDFEKGLSSYWVREMANNKYSGTVSTSYSQGGSSSFRMELRNTDSNVNGSKRSEIAAVRAEKPLEEHTYTFGMLLPMGGNEDYSLDPKGSEVIAQWHNSPDPGEEWTTPPIALRTFNGRYILNKCWDDAAITTTEQMTNKGNRNEYDLGSYLDDKGKWVTWSFHIKWGWLASQKPILEVYKNGVKILDLNGLPNTTNDNYGVKMKLGIYKWDWAHEELGYSILTNRVIYYDKFNIV